MVWGLGKNTIFLNVNGAIESFEVALAEQRKILDKDVEILSISPDARKLLLKGGSSIWIYDLWEKKETELQFVSDMQIETDPEARKKNVKSETVREQPHCFQWSPDSAFIAYIDSDGISLLSANGKGRNQILKGSYGYLQWMPKGTGLSVENAEGVFVVTTKGEQRDKILDHMGHVQWFPDETRFCYVKDRILFLRTLKDGKEIKIHTLDNYKKSSSTDYIEYAISPDGEKIAFVRNWLTEDKKKIRPVYDYVKNKKVFDKKWPLGGSSVLVYNLKTDDLLSMSKKSDTLYRQPQWSSDSKKLCYVDMEGLNWGDLIPLYSIIEEETEK